VILHNFHCEFNSLSKYRCISHFISTRNGGVSPHPFSSLNLSFRSIDKYENVLKNRLVLLDSLNIPIESVTLGKQIHSGNIAIVNDTDRGKGSRNYDSAINDSDALITNKLNICIMVLLADCVPIFFFDPKNMAIGIAHAGRAGTENRISVNTALLLTKYFNCKLDDIIVGIGPAISKKYYKVSTDTALQVEKSLPSGSKSITYNDNYAIIDISLANQEQLVDIGIPEKNIESSNLCTFSLPDIFFSERRDGKPTGRFGAGIMLVG
jgi:YfiH family protein